MNEFLDRMRRLGDISSFDQLSDWYLDLPLWGQIVLGLGLGGILLLLIIFVKAAFADKNY